MRKQTYREQVSKIQCSVSMFGGEIIPFGKAISSLPI